MKPLFQSLYILLLTTLLALCLWRCEMAGSADVAPGTTGVGGSMARFAITDNTLYIVTRQSLEVYDISAPAEPVRRGKAQLGLGIETIFPYQKNLYIGANDGMYIFDNRQPQAPVLLSKYTHVMSCDPVVVQGTFAYVTLRGGVACRQWNNQSSLDVVDVSNPSNPRLLHSQPLLSPYGLGVDGNRLFVCEGEKGLKVFDISNPALPAPEQFLTGVPAYDVIPYRNTLLVTGSKGLYQYRYDAAEKGTSLELLSKIPVE
jgi:hypothetical protein